MTSSIDRSSPELAVCVTWSPDVCIEALKSCDAIAARQILSSIDCTVLDDEEKIPAAKQAFVVMSSKERLPVFIEAVLQSRVTYVDPIDTQFLWLRNELESSKFYHMLPDAIRQVLEIENKAFPAANRDACREEYEALLKQPRDEQSE